MKSAPKKPKPSDIKAVELAISNLINSNTMIFNSAIGYAASRKEAIDPKDPDQIREISKQLLVGGL